LIPYPRDVLSGWESRSARIEEGSISGISGRPRTPRCAGSRPQPTNRREFHDILSDQARVDMESII